MLSYLLIDFAGENQNYIKAMKDLTIVAASCAIDLGFGNDKVRVNAQSLYMALDRYVRDAFAFQRAYDFIEERFKAVSNGMTTEKIKEMSILKDDLIDKLKNCGMRITSESPIVEKRCALLLYHLTMHRPFYIARNMPADVDGQNLAYFNAIVSTIIVAAAMASHILEFYINENFAKDVLRDLTHRTMSRSAIEAMMRYAIITKTT